MSEPKPPGLDEPDPFQVIFTALIRANIQSMKTQRVILWMQIVIIGLIVALGFIVLVPS